MAYVKPAEVLESMIQAGTAKGKLSIFQMVLRGFLSGAILAYATTLAFTATSQTSIGLVGAMVFPIGFVIIVLLGLELVTGSFALIPVSLIERKTTLSRMLANYGWVIVGHLLGCGLYAILYTLTITKMGTDLTNPLIQVLTQLSETKTIGYKKMGIDGMALVVIKAILCNWMVTLGVVMAMTSKSTGGKILAMWLPILAFFAQGFEHAVVNMFVIPAGILLGAHVTVADWWLWNQIPVLLGNFIGGALLTGLMFYLTQRKLTGPKAAKKLTESPEPGLRTAAASPAAGTQAGPSTLTLRSGDLS